MSFDLTSQLRQLCYPIRSENWFLTQFGIDDLLRCPAVGWNRPHRFIPNLYMLYPPCLLLNHDRFSSSMGNSQALGQPLAVHLNRVLGIFRPLPIKTEIVSTRSGSEAFFHVDVSRVRRSASRQLPISTEAAPPLSPTVFFLAVPRALSKSIRADCKKARLPAVLSANHGFLSQS